ncbi:PAS domain-containing protein [Dyella sp. KRB-257]|uniref:PAS domain-containing protein n=1 Tax=Dyella sp. KRB-257 TaxID=3400915 RepID=UPI003C1263C9
MAWPYGDSPTARRIRRHDWTATPLGPLERWPQSLKTALDLMIGAEQPVLVAWGEELTALYNRAFAALLGEPRGRYFGAPCSELCGERWPMLDGAVRAALRGEPQLWADQGMKIGPDDLDTGWFTVSWMPLRDESDAVSGIYCTVVDTTEKVRAQQILRESRDRQAFLLALSDALRPLSGLRAIQRVASRLIGEHLQADRVGFAERDDDDDDVHILEDWSAPDMPPLGAMHCLSSFHPSIGALLWRGVIVRIDDIRTVCEHPADLAMYQRWNIGAALVVPLRRDDQFNGSFYVHQRIPRRWSDGDARLVQRAAERVWIAIQWAAAERSLRHAQQRRRFLLLLSDTLRGLDQSATIKHAGCQLLGEQLQLDRVAYVTVDAAGQLSVQGWSSATGFFDQAAAPATAEHALADTCWQHKLLVIHDVANEDRIPPHEREALLSAGIGALVTLQIAGKEAARQAAFGGASRSARQWSREDVDLIKETAGRLWSAVERARALEQLTLREAELAQVQRSGGVGGVIIDMADGMRSQRSPEYRRLHGLSPEVQFEGHEEWLARVHPKDRKTADRAVREAIAHGDSYTSEYRIVRPDNGAVRWISAKGEIQRDADGRALRLVGIHLDITERKEMEAALKLSERRLQTLISGMPQLVWRAEEAGRWIWASPQWADFTGQRAHESLGRGWLEPVHPEDRGRVCEAWEKAESSGALSIDHRILGRAGQRYRWFQTRAAPVRNADGGIREWLGTSTDVDEMRTLQDHQQVLLDELQHRTRNLMGVVSVLARRTVASSTDLDAFAVRFDDRLAALSRANNLLSGVTDGQRISFDALLRQELDALGVLDGQNPPVEMAGTPGIALRSSTVQILALALHELGTNAVKYGALAQPGRQLSVRWWIDAQVAPQCLVVQWRETGVPMADSGGFGYGRELIERALPYQLGATTTYTFTPDGVLCVIRLPISAQ